MPEIKKSVRNKKLKSKYNNKKNKKNLINVFK